MADSSSQNLALEFCTKASSPNASHSWESDQAASSVAFSNLAKQAAMLP